MQKIWITGESGSGKTTLARALGKKYNIPVYHRDSISWGKNDYERTTEEQLEIIKMFTSNNNWIFEGNMYTLSKKDGRLDNCDTIIHLEINRFLCVYRGFMRWIKHRNNPREEFAEGCKENYPISFVLDLILRKKTIEREKFRLEAKEMGKNVINLKGIKEINAFYKKHELKR
jgi:adenylate kinase family enzyme